MNKEDFKMTDDEYKQLRNEYVREWRKKHPEKVKATNERFYKKQKEKKEQEKERTIKNEFDK